MLTLDEIDFIRHHGISGTFMLVHHLPGSFWKAEAKRQGINFVIGNDCNKGHRLKSRSGHCIQCNPASIGFQLRYSEPGFIYIARSEHQLGLTKIGVTRNLDSRAVSLCQDRYGGANDWEISFSRYVQKAGEVEHKVFIRLQKARVARTYEKEGRQQQALELFDVSADEALSATTQVLSHKK